MSITRFQTKSLLCTRDGAQWGEYVREGETYTVEIPLNPRSDVHFTAPSGAGTFMRYHQYQRALVNGWLIPA